MHPIYDNGIQTGYFNLTSEVVQILFIDFYCPTVVLVANASRNNQIQNSDIPHHYYRVPNNSNGRNNSRGEIFASHSFEEISGKDLKTVN